MATKTILTKKPKSVEITIDGEKFTISEMLGGAYTDFMRKQSTRFRFGTDGKPTGAPDVTNMYSDLIVRCMRDHKGEFVTVQFVDELPKEAVEALFQNCQEINGLVEKKDEKKSDTPTALG